MEYYSFTERKGILTHALTWMDLEDIRLISISSHAHKILYKTVKRVVKLKETK